MASSNVVTLPRATCLCAPIEFLSGLSQAEPLSIKIDVLAEVVLPNFRGLGLIARCGLEAEELRQLGPIAAKALGRPYDLLAAEVEQAMTETKGGDGIDSFRRRNAGSIHVLEPESMPVDTKLLALCVKAQAEAHPSVNAALAGIRQFLTGVLEDRMLELIWDTMPPSLGNCQFAVAEPLAA